MAKVISSHSDCVGIESECKGYDLTTFCIASHYEDVLSNVLIPWLADARGLTTLCVLKGEFKFYADLLNAIDHENRTKPNSVAVSVDFIRVESYVNCESSGKVRVVGIDNLEFLKGKDVLIVEDVVESGKTITKLLEHVNQFEPNSVKVANLYSKADNDPNSPAIIGTGIGMTKAELINSFGTPIASPICIWAPDQGRDPTQKQMGRDTTQEQMGRSPDPASQSRERPAGRSNYNIIII